MGSTTVARGMALAFAITTTGTTMKASGKEVRPENIRLLVIDLCVASLSYWIRSLGGDSAIAQTNLLHPSRN